MTDYKPQELVDAFVENVSRHFQALEQHYHLERSLAAVVLGGRGLQSMVLGEQGLQSIQPEEVGNRFFLLTLKLYGPAFTVVITYGDREHDIGCSISSSGFKQSYGLWEWLYVLGKPELLVDHGACTLTTKRIATVLAQYEAILSHILPAIVQSGRNLESRLEHERQELLHHSEQRQVEEEHMRLASEAVEAFHRKDYVSVVRALSAVKGDLTRSEAAKLAYAQKQLKDEQ